jgi:hypothetical protein
VVGPLNRRGGIPSTKREFVILFHMEVIMHTNCLRNYQKRMYIDIRYCPSNEIIEAYSCSKVTDTTELATLEEHLLVCHVCQDQLTLTDTYVRTVRTALAQFDVIRDLPAHTSDIDPRV